MLYRDLMKRLRATLSGFARDEGGATLPLLAVSLVALVGFVGIAIDTARAQMVQSKMLFSLDAAGLAAGSTVSTTNLQTEASKYMNANFNGFMGATVTGFSIVANTDNTVFTVSATATLPTVFMGLLGINSVTLNATSQVTRAVTGLELVMVLDNTGSMEDSAGGGTSKISALKTAATTLVNTLFGSKDTITDGKLWVGVVPFSQAVNIGTSHPTWMDDDYDATITDWGPNGSWYGCVDARLNGYDVSDTPPSQGNVNSLFRQYYWISDNLNPDGVANSGYNIWKTPHYSWKGVTYTYASPLNTTYKGPNLLCPQEVTPMTNTKTTIVNAINNMQARGDTLISEGVAWGWHMISPSWRGKWGGTMDANDLPLDYGTKGMAKAVVILTDGINTIGNTAHGAYWFLGDKRLGTTNSSTAVTTLNSKTVSVCNAMKAKGVYVYTIALGTGVSTASKNMLQSCATGDNYYFYAPSTSTLSTVFSTIGDSLSNLRVSK